jgi:hypothetical protein
MVNLVKLKDYLSGSKTMGNMSTLVKNIAALTRTVKEGT